MAWVDSELDIAYQIEGGKYLHMTPYLADFTLDVQAQFSDFDVFAEWPEVVEIGYASQLSLSGLLAGKTDVAQDLGRDVVGNGRRNASFMFAFPEHNFLGPVGYIKIPTTAIPNNDGVLVVDSAARGTHVEGFERWRYGRISVKNPNQSSFASSPIANSQLQNPVAGQWVIVHVVNAGGLTSLNITYRHSSTDYLYSVPLDAGKIEEGLHIAQLKTASTSATIPNARLTGGQWQIARAGTVGTAEYYIGFIEY